MPFSFLDSSDDEDIYPHLEHLEASAPPPARLTTTVEPSLTTTSSTSASKNSKKDAGDKKRQNSGTGSSTAGPPKKRCLSNLSDTIQGGHPRTSTDADVLQAVAHNMRMPLAIAYTQPAPPVPCISSASSASAQNLVRPIKTCKEKQSIAKQTSKSLPKPTSKSVPKAAPKAAPKVAAKAAPKAAPKPAPKAAPKPAPKAAPKQATQLYEVGESSNDSDREEEEDGDSDDDLSGNTSDSMSSSDLDNDSGDDSDCNSDTSVIMNSRTESTDRASTVLLNCDSDSEKSPLRTAAPTSGIRAVGLSAAEISAHEIAKASMCELQQVLEQLGNSSGMFPCSSVRLAKQACQTFEQTPEQSFKSISLMANSMRSAFQEGSVESEVANARAAVANVETTWTAMLPAIMKLKERTEKQANEAAETARAVADLFSAGQGLIESASLALKLRK
jgi:hypothetical protein